MIGWPWLAAWKNVGYGRLKLGVILGMYICIYVKFQRAYICSKLRKYSSIAEEFERIIHVSKGHDTNIQITVPGTSIGLQFLLIIQISSYLLKPEEFLFSTILSVRGSLAGLKSFPESSRIWESVQGTFFLRSICVLLAFSCVQG